MDCMCVEGRGILNLYPDRMHLIADLHVLNQQYTEVSRQAILASSMCGGSAGQMIRSTWDAANDKFAFIESSYNLGTGEECDQKKRSVQSERGRKSLRIALTKLPFNTGIQVQL